MTMTVDEALDVWRSESQRPRRPEDLTVAAIATVRIREDS